MKTIKLNDSVLDIKLNAENRARFRNVILEDAIKHRSDNIRNEMKKLQVNIINRSWGKTPQARAANLKLSKQAQDLEKKIESRGLECATFSVGHYRMTIDMNLAGSKILLWLIKSNYESNVINFDYEFLTRDGTSDRRESFKLGNERIICDADDPITLKFFELKHEADEIAAAGEELTAILNTILGKARTLRDAVKKWPELANYTSAIMSASREIIVRPEDLNAKITALKNPNTSTKKAMGVKA